MTYSSALFDADSRAGAPARVPRTTARRRPAPQDRPAARPGRGGTRHPGARDRHRLGRAGHPGRAPRRHGAHAHPLPGAAGAWPPAGSPRPGSADRVDVELRDYRDVDGEFDAIVSVEMIEAVGERYWPTYFATLDRLLAPGGRIGLQAITMAHDRMLATRRTYTWIHKYIFPGGLLPSVRASRTVLAAAHPAAGHGARGLRRPLRGDAPALARAVRRARRRGRRPRLRRDLPPDVELLPVLLRGRLPGRVPRRQPAHPGPDMTNTKPMSPAEVIAGLLKDHAWRRASAARLGRQRGGPAGSAGRRAPVPAGPAADPVAPGRARPGPCLRQRRPRRRGRPRRRPAPGWGALRDAPARGLALAPAAVAAVKAVARLKLLGPPPPPPAPSSGSAAACTAAPATRP